MKRKLYLHVGPHKTGTTLIQKVCLDNQEKLLKNGLFYPKNYVRIFGHHLIRDLIKDRKLESADLDFFNGVNSDVLLSSEDFISFSVSDFQYLKKSFESFDVHIIYSWRRASLKMYSIWQELIKHGQSVSFFEFYHEHLARPAQSYMLSADSQVRRFESVFGNKNIHLIDYDKAVVDDDLLEQFFSIINCEYQEDFLKKSKNVMSSNRSLNPYDTELIRALNLRMQLQYHIAGNTVRETYLSHYDSLDKETLSFLLSIMKENVIELSVGSYFIDKRVEKAMKEKYQDNIVNCDLKSYQNNILLVKDNWLIDPRTSVLLDKLTTQLNEILTNV